MSLLIRYTHIPFYFHFSFTFPTSPIHHYAPPLQHDRTCTCTTISLAPSVWFRLFDGHMTYNSHVFTFILSVSNVPPPAVRSIMISHTAWSGTSSNFTLCSHSYLPFIFNLPVFTFWGKIITEAPTNCLYESPPELRFSTYTLHHLALISHYFALFRITSHCHNPTVSTSHNTPPEPWIEAMSNTLEYESGDEISQGSSEYHSGQESEPDSMQIILVNHEEEFMFLNIRFPMPSPFPHPYIQLKELMTTVTTTPESYNRITDISGNPHWALGYILYHFNIDRVSRSIWAYHPCHLDQVYYSTYVDPSWYKSLLNYYNLTHKRLEDALAKEWLEVQSQYGCYLVPDELTITLMDCIL